MELFSEWIESNWIDVVQSIGIISGLVFTAAEFRLRRAEVRVQARFDLTRHHFDVWELTFSHPELGRVLSKSVDLASDPVTVRELRFVNSLILHLDASLEAAERGIYVLPEGIESDIQEFFALPIPRRVWLETAHLRSKRLRRRIDGK